MNRLNNKGFTLVELLAVLVILVAIMSIAIPTINSSLERSKASQNEQRKKERSKASQNEQRKKLLESAAELYVADNKNNIDKNCVRIRELKKSGYINGDAMKDADGEIFSGCVVFTYGDDNYVYSDNPADCGDCIGY